MKEKNVSIQAGIELPCLIQHLSGTKNTSNSTGISSAQSVRVPLTSECQGWSDENMISMLN